MASFYSNLSNEEDMLQTTYFLNQKLGSYPSSELPNDKTYESQHSVSLSYSNLLSNNDRGEIEDECIGSRDEMIFIPPTRMHQIDGEMNHHGSEPIQNYHGLSLSLGSQVQSSLDLNHYTNSSLYSMVSSDMQSEIQSSQNNGLKNVQYLSFDLAGKNSQDTVKYEDLTNFHQNMIISQTTNFIPSLTFFNSKYIKAAQDLLEDVVNVHKLSKQSEKKYRDFNDHDGSAGIDMKLSSEVLESNDNSNFRDLLPSERHDLQNKKTKLFSMLDEVDKRYKQYFHQMQAVASSFDAVAGPGSAQPYTSLALQTISRQFRSLRDAIKKQIQSTQKSLGEEDSNLHGQNVLSRLRYVDQQLRQQKSFQQFGITRQPWRPQRGLPETAVSVLRAWLFEHFLHPYPKDSEKIVLAKQTGLSRSQVANWFINARVRLWKPMIEDMYKEEFGDTETEPKSSPEQHQATTTTTTPRDFSVFDEREDKFQTGMINLMSEDNRHMQSYELRADDIQISSADVNLQREDLGYESGAFQDNEVNFGLTHLPNKQILNMAAWQ